MLFGAKRLVVLVARFGGSTTATGGAITQATWRYPTGRAASQAAGRATRATEARGRAAGSAKTTKSAACRSTATAQAVCVNHGGVGKLNRRRIHLGRRSRFHRLSSREVEPRDKSKGKYGCHDGYDKVVLVFHVLYALIVDAISPSVVTFQLRIHEESSHSPADRRRAE